MTQKLEFFGETVTVCWEDPKSCNVIRLQNRKEVSILENMEAQGGTVSLPSRNILAATVALGALAAGLAFLLYRCPLLVKLMSRGSRKRKQLSCSVTLAESMQWEPFHRVSQCCAVMPPTPRTIFIDLH